MATPGAPSVDALLEVAVAAARAGGAVLVEGLARPAEVQLKSERTSIVTWADVTAQDKIVDIVTAAFPDHAILGEEGLAGQAEGPCTWLVDPLDGTSNYAHGIPFACTSVAVRDAEGLAAGAIFEPFRGELFTASRDGGAWLGDERLAVSEVVTLDRAMVCTGIQADDRDAIEAYGRRIVELNVHCRAVRGLGSPALCLAYIAAGRIDAFLERDATYAWDVGAGGLMITEAGGRIEDLDGGAAQPRPRLRERAGDERAHPRRAGGTAAEDGRPGMTVSGKRVVVTGAGRGIGAELTAELRVSRRRRSSVSTSPAPTRCATSATRTRSPRFFRRVGRVDGLVNCAALLVNRRAYDEIPLDEFDRMLAVNVRGTFLCARAAGRVDGRPRRQHRERRLRDRVHRLARLRSLRRVEGGGHLAHSGARERDGQEEHPGELHRSGAHYDPWLRGAR